MFAANIYKQRRNTLVQKIKNGLLFFPGNTEVPYNYPANTYTFRQDSNFLYFFGLSQPDLAAVIDCNTGKEYLFGNDVEMDDIIWMGKQPLMQELAASVGVENSFPFSKLEDFLKNAQQKGQKIHYAPPYRSEIKILLHSLLRIDISQLKEKSSVDLISAIVSLRSIKDLLEIQEIDKMVDIAYLMHTTSMKMAKPGIIERQIAGTLEGISSSHGAPVSFPVILSMDGQTLHNHNHSNILQSGRLMVTDAGSESVMNYCSDITRTIPVGGKYSSAQKDIYNIVLKANTESIKAIKPGVFYKDIHLGAARIVVQGLKELGIMKGDVDEAVAAGAHAMFFPHGLGHMMGLDVHDMESLGENFVGYDAEVTRSDQFGLAFLRLARKLQPGFVITVEPGIYFIPDLIDMWRSEKRFEQFINYNKLDSYRTFGGIRIEDDILVTENSYRVLGKPIPKTVEDVEKIME